MQKAVKIDSSNEILLSIGEASEYLGVSIDTLRRWEKKDKIIALRSPGGHRYFKQKDLDNLFGRKYEREKKKEPRKIEKEVLIKETEKTPNQDTFSPQTMTERVPRIVTIPTTTPIKIIRQETQSATTLQTTSAVSRIQHGPPPQESILTPASINHQAQSIPISSVPPATNIKQEEVMKRSNVWIYPVVGLIILIIGFTIFVIFGSSTEVISPVPYI